jgi:hypothetical protein
MDCYNIVMVWFGLVCFLGASAVVRGGRTIVPISGLPVDFY